MHGIAIYDNADTLITSAHISAGSGSILTDKTRWIEVAPVSLLPGTLYTIMADDMCVAPTQGGDRCNVGSGGNITYDP